MKKLLILLMLISNFAYAADQTFCSSDEDFYDLRQCLANDSESNCRDLYPGCNVDRWQLDAQDVVSRMIDQCCVVGHSDAQWDACFLAKRAQIPRAKILPVEYRRFIAQTVLEYISNPELECTEH